MRRYQPLGRLVPLGVPVGPQRPEGIPAPQVVSNVEDVRHILPQNLKLFLGAALDSQLTPGAHNLTVFVS